MNYTIMTTDDIHNDLTIDLEKSGNKYVVGLWNKELHESTTKTFDNIEEAMIVYTKYVEAIATGCYSYETRRSWLQ